MTVYEKNPDSDGIPVEYGLYFCWWDAGIYLFIYQNGGRVLEEKTDAELWAKCEPTGKTVKVPADFIKGKTTCPLCSSVELELLEKNEQEFKYRLVLDDPETIEALQFLYDLVFVDKCAIVTEISMGVHPSKLFREGRVAINGPWPMFSMPDYRKTSFDWDAVEPPRRSKDKEGGRAVVTMFSSYALCKRSKHKPEAYRFLSYICGKEGQKIWASTGSCTPAIKSIAESEDFLDPKQRPANAEAFLACVQKNYSFEMPVATERWNDVGSIIGENIVNMLLGTNVTTPKTASATTVAEGNKILHKAETDAKRILKPAPWRIIFPILSIILLVFIGVIIRLFLKASKSLGPIERREQKWAILGVSPWTFGFLVFWIGPVLFSIVLSLCKWHSLAPLSAAKWVGFGNYFEMLSGQDEFFRPALKVSAIYALMQLPLSLTCGFIVALILNNNIRGIKLFRTIAFLPAVLPAIASITLWAWIFRPTSGILARLVEFLNLGDYLREWLHIENLNWLIEPRLILPSLVLMSLWGVGGGMIIYLAGLQSIPTQLYEAADIDGANWWHRLVHITIPQVSPVIFFNLVMGVIGALQVFMQAFLLTGEGGGTGRAANFYMLYLFNTAFIQHRFGYACAMAWILFVLIIGLTLLVFKSSPMWVYYEGEKRGMRK